MGYIGHSFHDNGVPLKFRPPRPSFFRACVGIVRAAYRAVLRFFGAFLAVSVRRSLSTVYDTGIPGSDRFGQLGFLTVG